MKVVARFTGFLKQQNKNQNMNKTLKLTTLKPNPFRDFRVDPVDQKQVKLLVDSINDYGFWGGAVCRKGNNGDVEVIAGWTRVQAGIKAGVKTADLFIGNFDDAATAKAYAIENATQRGNTVTALAGSVATAITLLARATLRDDLSTIIDTSKKALDVARGNLINGRGIGENLILEFLTGVPNINAGVIREQLANLKKSGDYARIISEVADRIEAEAQAEAKAAKQQKDRDEAEDKAEEARKTKAQAAKDKREFDFEGVSKHLTNSHQVKAFRKVALAKGVKLWLPVKQQAALAAELVKAAKELDEELSARFIQINMVALLGDAKAHERKLSKEEQKRIEAESVQRKFDALCENFRVGVNNMRTAGHGLLAVMSENRGVEFRISDSLVTHIKLTRDLLEKLVNGLAKRSSSKQQNTLAKLTYK
jgi:ParB-like chromosome segregation protein Spo0J